MTYFLTFMKGRVKQVELLVFAFCPVFLLLPVPKIMEQNVVSPVFSTYSSHTFLIVI